MAKVLLGMRWDEGHQSSDVEDRRGQGGGGGPALGGLFWLLPYLLRSRYGWILLLVGAVAWFAFQGVQRLSGDGGAPAGERTAQNDKAAQFVGFVLDDAQRTWAQAFAAKGLAYDKARLVLFTDSTRSGCGFGDAATGPFYCPRDRRVYIDLGFYDDLARRFGAPGDFAQAYVIAHEIGHHVQNLVGTSDRVSAAPKARQVGADGLSVRLELQADCFAGVWAHATAQRNILEAGDVEEGLRAAAAIGDDRLQKQAQGTVRPESFTHGTSEQRVRWFKRGYAVGTMDACDTFGADAKL